MDNLHLSSLNKNEKKNKIKEIGVNGSFKNNNERIKSTTALSTTAKAPTKKNKGLH